MIFYRGTGDGASWPPVFERVTGTYQDRFSADEGAHKRSAGAKAARVRHGVDVAPVFFDVDGDGDKDLIWGDFEYRSLFWAEDTAGNCKDPRYIVHEGFPDTVQLWSGGLNKPAIADIDADGDQDAFFGDFNGKLFFYRNTGGPLAAAYQRAESPFDTIDVGQFSKPAFADLDEDGDLDVVAGTGRGGLVYGENTAGGN